MGVPGWPESAAWTASIESERMVLILSWSRFVCSVKGSPASAESCPVASSGRLEPVAGSADQGHGQYDHVDRHARQQLAHAPLALERVQELVLPQKRQDARRDAAADVHAAGG